MDWPKRSNKFPHNFHFHHLFTYFTDAMPISSMGMALSDTLLKLKYAMCMESYHHRG